MEFWKQALFTAAQAELVRISAAELSEQKKRAATMAEIGSTSSLEGVCEGKRVGQSVCVWVSVCVGE